MLVIVKRQMENGNTISVGTFNDLFHPILFLKSLMDLDNESEKDGKYIVEYFNND